MTSSELLTYETLVAFFGWCSLINVGMLALATFAVVFLRGMFMPLHTKMFGARKDALSLIYLQYLAGYKIVVIVFNIVPYIALKIIA